MRPSRSRARSPWSREEKFESSLATSPSVPETPLICAATSRKPHADRRSRSSRIAFASRGLPVTIALAESFSISRSSLVTSAAARETSRHSPAYSRYPPAAPADPDPPRSAAPARLDRSISDAARATMRPEASRAYSGPPVSNARISATSASTSAWTRAMAASGTARAPRALRSARSSPRRSLRRSRCASSSAFKDAPSAVSCRRGENMPFSDASSDDRGSRGKGGVAESISRRRSSRDRARSTRDAPSLSSSSSSSSGPPPPTPSSGLDHLSPLRSLPAPSARSTVSASASARRSPMPVSSTAAPVAAPSAVMTRAAPPRLRAAAPPPEETRGGGANLLSARYAAAATAPPTPAPRAKATPGARMVCTPGPTTPTMRAPISAVAAKSKSGNAAPQKMASAARGLTPLTNQKSPFSSLPSTSAAVSSARRRTTK